VAFDLQLQVELVSWLLSGMSWEAVGYGSLYRSLMVLNHSIVASGPFVLLITQASGAYARQDEVTPFIACPESQPGYGSVSALSPKALLSTTTANSVALKKDGHVRLRQRMIVAIIILQSARYLQ
jgi:hypothetical protein